MKVSAKKISAAVSLAVMSGVSLNAGAAGFALIENSASGMGNAFAGGSAIADDAFDQFDLKTYKLTIERIRYVMICSK